jgi:hypothetical protein
MSREAFERGDWQVVIDAHPLESHDPEEWLRYGVALLQTIRPGPDVGKQQQQAALAFVQAQKEGASAEAVAAVQQRSVLISLAEALKLAGIETAAASVMNTSSNSSISNETPEASVHADAVPAGSAAITQMLRILADLYSLELPEGGSQMDQMIAAKQQLRQRGIAIEGIHLALNHARQVEQNLSDEVIGKLVAVLA